MLRRRISEHAAEVLRASVHQRYKLRRAIVITSNRVVQDWGKYLGDISWSDLRNLRERLPISRARILLNIHHSQLAGCAGRVRSDSLKDSLSSS